MHCIAVNITCYVVAIMYYTVRVTYCNVYIGCILFQI